MRRWNIWREITAMFLDTDYYTCTCPLCHGTGLFKSESLLQPSRKTSEPCWRCDGWGWWVRQVGSDL